MVEIAVAVLTLLSAVVPAFADPYFEFGTKVGSTNPDIGALLPSNSTPRTLKSLIGPERLVSFFFWIASNHPRRVRNRPRR